MLSVEQIKILEELVSVRVVEILDVLAAYKLDKSNEATLRERLAQLYAIQLRLLDMKFVPRVTERASK